jgi:hypothetical protein
MDFTFEKIQYDSALLTSAGFYPSGKTEVMLDVNSL